MGAEDFGVKTGGVARWNPPRHVLQRVHAIGVRSQAPVLETQRGSPRRTRRRETRSRGLACRSGRAASRVSSRQAELQENTVNRLLLMSNSERHLSHLPMAFSSSRLMSFWLVPPRTVKATVGSGPACSSPIMRNHDLAAAIITAAPTVRVLGGLSLGREIPFPRCRSILGNRAGFAALSSSSSCSILGTPSRSGRAQQHEAAEARIDVHDSEPGVPASELPRCLRSLLCGGLLSYDISNLGHGKTTHKCGDVNAGNIHRCSFAPWR